MKETLWQYEVIFTFGVLIFSLICVYFYILDKKAKKMNETKEGQREYANKYLPEKLKHKSKTVGKANSRNRISKKDRKKEKNNQV
ncbi:MAG: hypothetical protein ACRDD2_04570 [Sarcina sp.]